MTVPELDQPLRPPAGNPGRWGDEVDQIFDGDLVVMLADVTPACGVVLTPVTNFALRDRATGTVTVLSSLGAWRKLERIARNPRVALAFHTRRHGYCSGREYVLVQGIASFSTTPDRAWLQSITPSWERFMGLRYGFPWRHWTDVYHWQRVGVQIAVERVTVWPDLACTGAPVVHGSAPPAHAPAPQPPPANGSGPRVDQALTAKRAARLPDTLLGWVGADGLPVVVPVSGARSYERGVVLEVPAGVVPAGGRRAGLTSHSFTAGVLGQEQHVHTGWLTAEEGGDTVLYAPHTRSSYRLPPSKIIYPAAVGWFTRCGLREARRSGFLSQPACGPGRR